MLTTVLELIVSAPTPTNLESVSLLCSTLRSLNCAQSCTRLTPTLPVTDEARVIDDMLDEHEAMNTQVTTLQDLIHGS